MTVTVSHGPGDRMAPGHGVTLSDQLVTLARRRPRHGTRPGPRAGARWQTGLPRDSDSDRRTRVSAAGGGGGGRPGPSAAETTPDAGRGRARRPGPAAAAGAGCAAGPGRLVTIPGAG